MMIEISRRQLLISSGPCIGAAAGLLARMADPAVTHDAENKLPWRYLPLDPRDTADRAYELFSKGGCMYAVFASIMNQLSERIGAPYNSFPIDMMRYGGGGLAGLGSLCGAVNGAGAALSLLAANGKARSRLTKELAHWYMETELPLYVPKGTADATDMPRSRSNSLLCKDSVATWRKVSGSDPDNPQGAERCRRLSADVARRTVELLNESQSRARHAVPLQTTERP